MRKFIEKEILQFKFIIITIQKLRSILKPREQKKFARLLFAILLMGFLEVVGIASILPFMQLLAEPDAIEKSSLLTQVYEYFNFGSHRSILMAAGIGVIILLTISNLFSAFAVWLQFKYSWQVAHNLGTRLLRTYLQKPYSYFLNKNSSELQTYLVGEVTGLTMGIIIPALEMLSRSVVALVIFGLLLWVDMKVALTMATVLGGAYLLIYFSQRRLLSQLGEKRIKKNLLRYKTLSELLSGIKTVKVSGTQGFFYERYEGASKDYCHVQPQVSMIMAAPRYFLEIFAFGGILSVTLYLYSNGGNLQSALPRLSLYAVAGYRLLPALQRAFTAASRIKHYLPVLDKLQPDLVVALHQKAEQDTQTKVLPFQKSINLENVDFHYENMSNLILDKFNVQIKKGEIVAFIGSTGAGKTTLIDLIVGLLNVTNGALKVDNQIVNKDNQSAWQKQIAYVPQEVFLFDDTIARNIVIGESDEKIDMERVKMVTKMADIYEFISKELPNKFDEKIGERGVRLSGGQRQRLGLARALYRSPAVLVLDEATSALDTVTENSIIETLKMLPDEITTIIIAHRLSTVRHADCIYLLENGKIKARGSYADLEASSIDFQEMVELS